MTKEIPAFPTTQYVTGFYPSGHTEGMTLRDYFAAKAMQGFASTIDISDADYQEHFGYIAKDCYEIADAMLEARK